MVPRFTESFLMCILSLRNMSKEKMKTLNFPKCQDLTAKACYMSKSPVLLMWWEARKEKHKWTENINIPRRMTNPGKFQKKRAELFLKTVTWQLKGPNYLS
jgi:hypothetical protein